MTGLIGEVRIIQNGKVIVHQKNKILAQGIRAFFFLTPFSDFSANTVKNEIILSMNSDPAKRYEYKISSSDIIARKQATVSWEDTNKIAKWKVEFDNNEANGVINSIIIGKEEGSFIHEYSRALLSSSYHKLGGSITVEYTWTFQSTFNQTDMFLKNGWINTINHLQSEISDSAVLNEPKYIIFSDVTKSANYFDTRTPVGNIQSGLNTNQLFVSKDFIESNARGDFINNSDLVVKDFGVLAQTTFPGMQLEVIFKNRSYILDILSINTNDETTITMGQNGSPYNFNVTNYTDILWRIWYPFGSPSTLTSGSGNLVALDNALYISGDKTKVIFSKTEFRLFNSDFDDGVWQINTVTFNAGNTKITFSNYTIIGEGYTEWNVELSDNTEIYVKNIKYFIKQTNVYFPKKNKLTGNNLKSDNSFIEAGDGYILIKNTNLTNDIKIGEKIEIIDSGIGNIAGLYDIKEVDYIAVSNSTQLVLNSFISNGTRDNLQWQIPLSINQIGIASNSDGANASIYQSISTQRALYGEVKTFWIDIGFKLGQTDISFS